MARTPMKQQLEQQLEQQKQARIVETPTETSSQQSKLSEKTSTSSSPSERDTSLKTSPLAEMDLETVSEMELKRVLLLLVQSNQVVGENLRTLGLGMDSLADRLKRNETTMADLESHLRKKEALEAMPIPGAPVGAPVTAPQRNGSGTNEPEQRLDKLLSEKLEQQQVSLSEELRKTVASTTKQSNSDLLDSLQARNPRPEVKTTASSSKASPVVVDAEDIAAGVSSALDGKTGRRLVGSLERQTEKVAEMAARVSETEASVRALKRSTLHRVTALTAMTALPLLVSVLIVLVLAWGMSNVFGIDQIFMTLAEATREARGWVRVGWVLADLAVTAVLVGVIYMAGAWLYRRYDKISRGSQ